MTFTEWYEETRNEPWHEDYALLVSFIQEMEDAYYTYCHENDLEPIWNG